MGNTNTLGDRAVVIGAGMAGLFAARVLSDHFDQVVVLDRDEDPNGPDPRKCVPQGHHFHVLLPGGLDAMNSWFDGFTDDLVATGSIELQIGRDFVVYTPAGKSYSLQTHVPEPVEGGDMTYVQSRPQLEHNVRRRVSSLPKVELRYGSLVAGPLVDDTGGRVTGVALRDGEKVSADLVVDASGRNSCTARWLPDLGYEPAPETYVNVDVHYASLLVEPADFDAFEGSVFFVMPSNEGDHASRGGAIVKMPGGRWLVNLGARYDDPPPTDWESFRAWGPTLVDPIWSEMIEHVTPLTNVSTYRMPRAVRHHYERLDRFPEGLVPIGDSVCFFNPTHGQGMSSAAGQCRGLEDLLAARSETAAGLDRLALDFFPVAAEWVRGPWILAALGDFGHPDCTGDFPADDLPDLELLGRLAAAAPGSPERRLANDVGTLRVPLSQVRSLAPA